MINNTTIIVAHRGLSSIYPENTLIAFSKALEIGADFIEIDVRLSRDKEIVVIHDETLERTTDGKGSVDQLTFNQIRKCSAGNWFSESFAKEKVPSLKEVFKLVDKKIKLMIEIKQSGMESILIDLIERYDMTENVICISYFIESLKIIKKLNSAIPVGILKDCFDHEKLKDYLKANINMILTEFSHFTLDVLKTCQSYGFTLGAGTLNKEEDLRKGLEIRLPIIITDYPQILKKLLRDGSNN